MISDVSQLFRQAMRRFPAAVTVVTARGKVQGKDTDCGMTATAVTSLSMDPPSLLVCVNRNSSFHSIIEESDTFCVNVLREGQHQISSNFGGAKPADERFSEGDWREEQGLLYLADAQAAIFCKKGAVFMHSTHTIVVGEATGLILHDTVAPLLYVDGRYATLSVG
jgi:flavin reductase (DIM6/NTAB) family NADH-FMN oxidoreductase RutF